MLSFVFFQLACARINSVEGQNYLSAMSAAANYAWVNRSSMTFLARQVMDGFFAVNILNILNIDFELWYIVSP